MDNAFSRQVQDVYVISDLHLSADNSENALFQADDLLASFFHWIFQQKENSLLVLNGDVLDFLAPRNKEEVVKVFDPLNAPNRVRQIMEAHPAVFDALGTIARSHQHQLVILSGNHDPELAIPAVREVVEQELSNSTEHADIVWQVHGEALRLQVGAARVLIEHGDNLDDWNRIDHQKLLSAIKLTTRGLEKAGVAAYTPPPGSYVVTDHMNAIRGEYPWVDMLKPEFDAVVPLLRKFLPLKQKSKLAESFEAWLDLIGRTREAYYHRLFDPTDNYRNAKGSRRGDADSRQELVVWWEELKTSPERGGRTAETDARLIKRLRKAAAHCHFFAVDKEGDPSRWFGLRLPTVTELDLRFLLNCGNDLIVHGHTHAAKAYPITQGLYLNSGTWGQLMKLPAADADTNVWQQFYTDLRAKRFDSVCRPTFIHIQANADSHRTTAGLLEWRADDSPLGYAAFHFDELSRIWETTSVTGGNS